MISLLRKVLINCLFSILTMINPLGSSKITEPKHLFEIFCFFLNLRLTYNEFSLLFSRLLDFVGFLLFLIRSRTWSQSPFFFIWVGAAPGWIRRLTSLTFAPWLLFFFIMVMMASAGVMILSIISVMVVSIMSTSVMIMFWIALIIPVFISSIPSIGVLIFNPLVRLSRRTLMVLTMMAVFGLH